MPSRPRAPATHGPRRSSTPGGGHRSTIDPALVWERLAASNTVAYRRGSPGYPSRLVDDRAAPEVLFSRGSIAQLDRPCVALVGTRSATHYGSGVAAELGADLSDAGVVVVSGLAAGIDAAAHEGALAPGCPAPPVAVVGGGVDVVYPASSSRLWARLELAGGILSEAAPGAAPERWRFPLRNRLIAALAHVLVVVESHKRGGALHTVTAADERGVTVLAVPGSVRSPASEGTNSLLQTAAAWRETRDLLAALELRQRRQQLRAWSVHRAMRTEGLCSAFPAGGHRPSLPGRACCARGSRRCCDSVRARVRALRPGTRPDGGHP